MENIDFEKQLKQKEEVIDRLISENSKLNRLIKLAKFEFSFIEEIEGLDFEPSIKKIMKNYKNQKFTIKKLESEIKKLTRDKNIY